jgi:fucose permease
MGIAGGAIVPLLYATLKKETGLNLPNHVAFFICVLPCYLYILYYSMKGYRKKM